MTVRPVSHRAIPMTFVVMLLVMAVVLPAVGRAQGTAQPPADGPLPLMPRDDELATLQGAVLSPLTPDATPDLLAAAAATATEVGALTVAEWRLPIAIERLRGDRDAAFRFVRDHIGLDVYPGILRGPDGTLAARSGNVWDRALLLRAMLDGIGLTTRLATGELDAPTTERVLQRVFDGPAVPLQDGRVAAVGALDVTALGERARRDDARLRVALGDRLDTMTAQQLADLAPEVRSHVWVQVRWGTGWVDLDPTLPDSTPGTSLTTATTTLDTAPADLRHTVRTQVIAASLDGDTVTERVVLDDTTEAATAARQQRFLYFQPSAEGLGGVINDSLSGVQSWTPVLMVDGQTTVGSAFLAGGRGTDVFGDPVDEPPLVSLRVVVTRHVPDRTDVAATHWLVDRIPPALADAATITADQLAPLPGDRTGPLAMGVIEQQIISTGGASAYDAAVQRGVAADFLYRLLSDPETSMEHSLGDLLYPVAAATNVLVTGSEQVTIPAVEAPGQVRAWVDGPRVTLVDLGQDPVVPDMFGLSTDLLIDDVRVVARDAQAIPEAVLRTVWYGVLQAALESAVAERQLQGLSDQPIVPIGASFASGDLRVLDTGDQATAGSALLRAALEAGRVALVPGDAASAVAWWEVDPRTAATRAVLDPGLGGVAGKVAWGAIKHLPPQPRITGPNGPNTWHVHPDGSIRRYPPGARPPGGGAPQGPPPSRCGGGSEYVTLVGCVSVPAAWVIRVGVGLVVSEVLGLVVMHFLT